MNLPTITGLVPHDVEQCILKLNEEIERLRAEIVQLRSQIPPTNAVARRA